MKHLQDLHVLVLGLGASGLAMARWCARHGAHVTVADTREAPPQLAALREAVPAAAFVSGLFTAALVEGTPVRAVYRSPGLAPATIAPVLDAARAMGLVVGGELDLFAQALADLGTAQPPGSPETAVLAITGTNGKTTVTALTGQLVARAGKSVAVAGNIGPTLLETLSRQLDAGTLPEVWVLELSSFQLDGVRGFEPTAAALLNITQDHLDWHGDMAAYAAAKARIFGTRGLMVLNRDDPAVMQLLPPPTKVRLQRPLKRAHVTFGAGLPRRPGDYGIERVNGMAWLVRAHEAAETHRRRRGTVAQQQDIHLQRLMPADALRIRGQHNALNALAALALASAAGCALAPMLYGLREYRGEPHRVESVAVIDAVEYFDDSKGTNVGATVAALVGLGTERSAGPPQAGSDGLKGRPVSGRLDQRGHEVPSVGATFDRKIVVILGGEGKGQDFGPLAEPVRRHARAVVLIGRDAPLIEAALTATGVALLHAAAMPEAVALAAARAHVGDAVLLSPACASFDMYKDYAHRAATFREAVRALAEAPSRVSEAGA